MDGWLVCVQPSPACLRMQAGGGALLRRRPVALAAQRRKYMGMNLL